MKLQLSLCTDYHIFNAKTKVSIIKFLQNLGWCKQRILMVF